MEVTEVQGHYDLCKLCNFIVKLQGSLDLTPKTLL